MSDERMLCLTDPTLGCQSLFVHPLHATAHTAYTQLFFHKPGWNPSPGEGEAWALVPEPSLDLCWDLQRSIPGDFTPMSSLDQILPIYSGIVRHSEWLCVGGIMKGEIELQRLFLAYW